MEPLPLIFDFTEDDIHKKWIVVNDNVMGGRSKGGFDFKNEKLVFSGSTNTNGGGFSSIRTIPIDFYLKNKTGFHIRYKGDGRTYKLGVRMEGKSVSYRTNFDTGNGHFQCQNWYDRRQIFPPYEHQVYRFCHLPCNECENLFCF